MSEQSSSIRLRPFTREDRKVTLSWRNLPEVRDAVMGFRYPVTDVMEEKWYDKVLDGDDNSSVYFAAELIADTSLIGFLSLTDINYQTSNAQLGVMIGDVNQHSRGLGGEVLNLGLDFAFGSLNLNRIYVMVRATNKPAIGLFSSASFLKEGSMRQHYFQDGRYEDVLIMGLLKHEYGAQSL